MINFNEIYNSLNDMSQGTLKKLEVDSALKIYYGTNQNGNLRIAFLSKSCAPILKKTKLLSVEQGFENNSVFWTCFDLLDSSAKSVFIAFCENLIESIADIMDEEEALSSLRKRYLVWRSLFKQVSEKKISNQTLQGLYGELYFLKHYMLEKYDIKSAINAWGGPDAKSKDFAKEEEWFEIKTVGEKSLSVHISSIEQLASEHDGHLAIIKVEPMSNEFSNGESSIGELFKYFISRINDEELEELFVNKLKNFGFDSTNESFNAKFDVKSIDLYKVDDNFPRITFSNIPYSEICDTNYSLVINSLEQYKEE